MALFLVSGMASPSHAKVVLRYASDVPGSERLAIEGDLRRLAGFRGVITDPTAIRVLDATGPVDAGYLQGWLQQRIHIITSLPAEAPLPMKCRDEDHVFPDGPLPDIAGADLRPTRNVVMMSNIGVLAYLNSKMRGCLATFGVPGGGTVVVDSPRVGIVNMAPEAFGPALGYDPKGAGASYARLAGLFHEARHSDGAGRLLGFTHSLYPAGSPFAGLAGCDTTLNGAYAVEAVLLQAFADACAGCSAKDVATLRRNAEDRRSRMLGKHPDPDAPDVKQLQRVLGYCATVRKDGLDVPPACHEYEEQLREVTLHPPPDLDPSWADTTPEGLR